METCFKKAERALTKGTERKKGMGINKNEV